MAIFGNYDTFAVPRLKLLVTSCQHMLVLVTVGTLVHEDMICLSWMPFVGEHLVCRFSGEQNNRILTSRLTKA